MLVLKTPAHSGKLAELFMMYTTDWLIFGDPRVFEKHSSSDVSGNWKRLLRRTMYSMNEEKS